MTDTTSQHSSPDGFHIQHAEYLGDDAVSNPRVSKLLAELRQHRRSHPLIGATLSISELEALPGGSIVVDLVVDPDGDAMQKCGTGIFPWYMAGQDADETSYSARELEDATLLYIPESKVWGA